MGADRPSAMLVLLTEPLAKIALVFRYMTYFGLGLLGHRVAVHPGEGVVTRGGEEDRDEDDEQDDR